MLFTEPVFAGFFLIVFLLRWALDSHGMQKNLLLAASYVFYGAWDYRFLVLIAGSTLLDFGVGRGLARATDETRRRRLLYVSLVGNLGISSTTTSSLRRALPCSANWGSRSLLTRWKSSCRLGSASSPFRP